MLTADQAFEILLVAIQDAPRQLQLMIDGVVAAQEFMPMPEEGWKQFVRDVEYTNEKRGLDCAWKMVGGNSLMSLSEMRRVKWEIQRRET